MDNEETVEKLGSFLQRKLEETGSEGYVVGVSGGIDSALTLKVAVEAVGKENVHAWILPAAPSTEENVSDARELCRELGVETREVDIEPVVKKFGETAGFDLEEETMGNIRARARMVYQYIDANENRMLVLGTGNRTEYLLGYFTKFGDGAVDLRLLEDLYKTEVRELARHIGLDEKFIEKEPTAGLWHGQTDEDELGTSYETLDTVLEHLVDRELSVEETAEETGIDREEVKRIQQMHRNSGHKRKSADSPEIR
ncbi:MAG: NAD+ synthase [Candidatus Nanohaloarchaea archaeon]